MVPRQETEKKSESLVEVAHRALEEHFVTLKLPPASVWSEDALSELVGIGRTPVREAVLRMAADGLVTVIRRAGTVISSVSIADQLIVLEARRELERLVSTRAARRSNDDERAGLRQMADRFVEIGESGDVVAYIDHQFKTKRYVAKCARNPYATRALSPLLTLSQRFFFTYHRDLDNLPVVSKVHAELVRAIASGNEASAAECSVVVSNVAESFTKELLLRAT